MRWRGLWSSKTTTPWKPSYLATFEAVVGVLALHAAEDVGRGAFLRVAERVSFRRCYLAVEVQADARVQGTGGAQPVEERAFQGDAVRYLHDALGGDAVYGAEGLLDPGVHRLRRVEASRRRGDVEDALREGAVLRGEVGDQSGKVGYLAFGRHRLRVRCPADFRPA